MIENLEKELSYSFNNKNLLIQALTHPSLMKSDYERLEFLGNSVVNLIAAEILYKKFPDVDEGVLSIAQSKMTSTEGIARVANNINLDLYIKVDLGEMSAGGAKNIRNLENCMEAIMGAIYLDGGYDSAKAVGNKLWNFYVENSIGFLLEKDPKSKLQEICQKNGAPIPSYKVIEQTGEAHAPTFVVECSVILDEKNITATATDGSKKSAERRAAAEVIKKIIY